MKWACKIRERFYAVCFEMTYEHFIYLKREQDITAANSSSMDSTRNGMGQTGYQKKIEKLNFGFCWGSRFVHG